MKKTTQVSGIEDAQTGIGLATAGVFAIAVAGPIGGLAAAGMLFIARHMEKKRKAREYDALSGNADDRNAAEWLRTRRSEEYGLNISTEFDGSTISRKYRIDT